MIRIDPEQNETRALFSFVELDGRRVLEIGSGDGRLTWRYAERADHVTAVEPLAPAVTHPRGTEPAAAAGEPHRAGAEVAYHERARITRLTSVVT
jgi:hypothetical protein